MFSIGDLVEYRKENRWSRERKQERQEAIGVVVDITEIEKDQNSVRVRWTDGNENLYFEEELALLSNGSEIKKLS